MWQRFTERARRVVFYAQEEAGKLGENYVSTEHMLLGLVRANDSVAARILERMDVSLVRIRSEIERKLTPGSAGVGQDMQLTPRGKRTIDLAYDEARRLGNNYVGTEHLLLGLIREGEGLAGRVLAKLGVDLERTRQEILALQDNDSGVPASVSAHGPFSDRARLALMIADVEAARLDRKEVCTELLLLALLDTEDCGARQLLIAMDLEWEQIRDAIKVWSARGDGLPAGPIQRSSHVARALALASEEAKLLQASFISTEHILLGIMREAKGLGGRILTELGADLETARKHASSIQSHETAHVPVERDLEEDGRAAQLAAEIAQFRQSLENAASDTKPAAPTVSDWYGKSLVSLLDVSREQIYEVLALAAAMKARRRRGYEEPFVRHRTLALLFEKPSLRTRVSFEAGMAQLNGTAIHLAPGDVGLGSRESVPDVAASLSRWVDVIAARVFKHETVMELAAHATVPVINALSDREHPVQMFADLLTLQEHKGALGNNLKVAYVGDGNNVLNALLLACARVGVNLSAACPPGYEPDPEYVEHARQIADASSGGSGAVVDVGTDPAAAVRDADVIYADVWTSMGQESEREARLATFAPYQVNAELVALARPDAIVMHCMPAHRGEEITAEIMDRFATVILDQAENRMHTQKALVLLMVERAAPMRTASSSNA